MNIKKITDSITEGKVEKQEVSCLTEGQKALKEKSGTPAEFAKACYSAVPSFLSMADARKGIDQYQKEWDSAI